MVKFLTILQIGALILLHFLPAKAQWPLKSIAGTKSLPAVTDRTDKRRGSRRSLEPGYFRTKLVAGAGQRWMDQQRVLRAMATEACNGYLCNGKGALPVTLISFNGSRQDTATVLLNWETSVETNNQRFEIERSLYVQQGFEMVGAVDAAGNTGSEYRFQDLNRWSEITYYRLKQIDIDGTSTYSRIISVKGARTALSIRAYPNPGTPDKMRFQMQGSENVRGVSIQLIDVKGAVLYSDDAFKAVGSKSFSLPKLSSLIMGAYILKVSNGFETAIVRFVIH